MEYVKPEISSLDAAYDGVSGAAGAAAILVVVAIGWAWTWYGGP